MAFRNNVTINIMLVVLLAAAMVGPAVPARQENDCFCQCMDQCMYLKDTRKGECADACNGTCTKLKSVGQPNINEFCGYWFENRYHVLINLINTVLCFFFFIYILKFYSVAAKMIYIYVISFYCNGIWYLIIIF